MPQAGARRSGAPFTLKQKMRPHSQGRLDTLVPPSFRTAKTMPSHRQSTGFPGRVRARFKSLPFRTAKIAGLSGLQKLQPSGAAPGLQYRCIL